MKVTPEKCFVGLDAYQKVIDSGVDVVLLATPPGFRPVHLKAAVDAGKHIFCEKPMATDAPGVRSVLESVKAAKEKNLVAGGRLLLALRGGAPGVLQADSRWRDRRHPRHLRHLLYRAGQADARRPASALPAMGDLEWQMRNWYNFTWLSGDGYVEQACHSVDKVAWAMKDQSPLKAVAVGGRQTPNNQGNIFDHMFVVYEFPDDVRAFVGQRQIGNTLLGEFGLPHGQRRLWQDPGLVGAVHQGQGELALQGAEEPTCTRTSTTSCSPASAAASRSTTASGWRTAR